MRLKAGTAMEAADGYFISIPFGAIKRRYVVRYEKLLIKFQFLLVRLKDSAFLFFKSATLISIPFGAIKRKKNPSPCTRSVISIPFGAIKRLAP